MAGLCRWLADVASKNWTSLSGGQLAPTFLDMPADVFVNICEWLSVRDILALRMANKSIAQVTQESIIWSSLLRRLLVPLPILPATSTYRFGEIGPRTYEWLMVRALYLEQNWRRANPYAAHSRFEAFERTIVMRMLPGGKYMVAVLKNLASGMFSLVVWDLDHAGRRVALTGAKSSTPFLQLEAKYGVVKNLMCIVIAFATPMVQKDNEKSTVVTVFAVPIIILEELAMHQADSETFRAYTETIHFPFSIIHQSSTSCDVGQLALGEFDGEMVLLVVHRPRALVFHYLQSGTRGNLLLGAIHPYSDLRHSIWSVKLLPGQNAVLVSRLLVEHGVPQDSTLFALDIFRLPGAGADATTHRSPAPVGRQLISGLHIDGFAFSDLETAWFAGLRDPQGILPAPANAAPPPISVFITTRQPRGFVQCLLRAEPIPDAFVALPYKRGALQRVAYALPAHKIARDVWTDAHARPVVLAGAYRSLVVMRPHVRPELLQEDGAAQGTEVLRLCTYATRAEGCEGFATPRATGRGADGADAAMEVDAPDGVAVRQDEVAPHKRSLRVPAIPNELAWDMMAGTTALAWDESVGRLCVATSADTAVQVLDFGGENWAVDVVRP